jgi:hypothetical protein
MQNRDAFIALTKPLIEWLNNNSNPHSMIVITFTSAELLEGAIAFHTEEYLKD